jgi:hypothetical protein
MPVVKEESCGGKVKHHAQGYNAEKDSGTNVILDVPLRQL